MTQNSTPTGSWNPITRRFDPVSRPAPQTSTPAPSFEERIRESQPSPPRDFTPAPSRGGGGGRRSTPSPQTSTPAPSQARIETIPAEKVSTPVPLRPQTIRDSPSTPTLSPQAPTRQNLIEARLERTSGAIFETPRAETWEGRQLQTLERSPPRTFVGGVATGVAQTGLSFIQFGRQVITQPRATAVAVGTSVVTFARSPIRTTSELLTPLSREIVSSPAGGGRVAGRVGSELAIGLGIGSATVRAARFGSATTARLRADFVPVQTFEARRVRVTQEGVLTQQTRDQFIDIPTTTTRERVLIRGGVATTAEDLGTQFSRAGTRVTAVTAQEGLAPRGFTSGVIRLRPVQTMDDVFFADPASRLRTSRLGSGDLGFGTDILNPDTRLTLTGQRPQAFVIPQAQIAPFPRDIAGFATSRTQARDLTPAQRQRLEQFQLKQRTDQFTSPGFVSPESEIVTTAPALQVQQRGVTVIGGRRVSLFEARLRDSPSTPMSVWQSRRAEVGRQQPRVVDSSRISPTQTVLDIRPAIITGVTSTATRSTRASRVIPTRQTSSVLSPNQRVSFISDTSPTRQITQASRVIPSRQTSSFGTPIVPRGFSPTTSFAPAPRGATFGFGTPRQFPRTPRILQEDSTRRERTSRPRRRRAELTGSVALLGIGQRFRGRVQRDSIGVQTGLGLRF